MGNNEESIKKIIYSISYRTEEHTLLEHESIYPPTLKAKEIVVIKPKEQIEGVEEILPYLIRDMDTIIEEKADRIVYKITYFLREYIREIDYFDVQLYIDFNGNCLSPGKHNHPDALELIKDTVEKADIIIYSERGVKSHIQLNDFPYKYCYNKVVSDSNNNISFIYKNQNAEDLLEYIKNAKDEMQFNANSEILKELKLL